jgi:RNA binding exosome subunit
MQPDHSVTWDKSAICTILELSDRAVVEALKRIYYRQTVDERSSKETIESNGRGFTGTDASFLTDIAQKMGFYGDRLTVRQMAVVRPRMKKYWRQLLEEAAEKGHQVSYKVAKSPKRATQ